MIVDWSVFGRDLRAAALAAHDGVLPDIDAAYSFFLANPELFVGGDDPEWPADMPTKPNIELVAAYYEFFPRQEDVIRAAAKGMGQSAISKYLEIAPSTATAHLQIVYRKLGISGGASISKLAIWAIQHGYGEGGNHA